MQVGCDDLASILKDGRVFMGDLSLLEFLLSSETDIRRFLDRYGLDTDVNLRCVFINSAASMRNRKGDQKFREVRRFREDLSLPENPPLFCASILLRVVLARPGCGLCLHAQDDVFVQVGIVLGSS